MIKGIGIDITNTRRFKTVKDQKKILQQIFTNTEISEIQHLNRKDQQCSVHFALKEAILKAFKIGLHFGSYWHNINIGRDFKITLSGYFKKFLKKTTKIHISHTCSKRYAIGFVLVQE